MDKPDKKSPPTKSSGHSSKNPMLLGVIVALITFAVFLPSVRFEFINYDDPDYVEKNRHVQGGLTVEGLRWAFFSSHASNWHPLTWVSHMLDVQFYGKDPAGHHFTNVLLHAGNTFILFLALWRMTGARWRSVFVAALFGLHPLHVEAVAWVAERKDVLSTFFWMLTIWAYARFVELKSQSSNLKPQTSKFSILSWYAAALLFFAMGLLSKPMVVTLPFVLLLLDIWPLQRISNLKSLTPNGKPGSSSARESGSSSVSFSPKQLFALVVEKIPFFALTAASCLLTFWAQKKGGAVTSIEALALGGRVSNALISYPRYLWKMIWPADLAVLYPHPWKWPVWQAALAALFLVAACALVMWMVRRRAYLFTGWFWFFGTLVPVIGLVQVGLQSIADRYTYVPLVGIFIIIAWGAAELVKAGRLPLSLVKVAAVLILAACVVKTSMQLQLWRNSGTLFQHAVNVTKGNFLAHNNLGYYLYNRGEEDKGMEHYRKALEIYPQFEVAWNNLGYAFANKGRYADAVVHYRQALKLKPDHADVHNNLGNALGNLDQNAEAMHHYRKALELKPDHVDAHNNIGVALAMEGKVEEGMKHLRESLRLKPGNASAHSNLGNAYAVQGKLDEAIEQYKLGLQLKPDDPQAHNNLANALAAKGRAAEAIEHYQLSLKYSPDNPETHFNLGYVYTQQQRRAEARRHFEEALRLRPNYPAARQQLNQLTAGTPSN